MRVPHHSIFRPNLQLAALAGLLATQMARKQEFPKKSAPDRTQHRIGKRERKRRDHIRRINPHRKH